MKRKFLSTLGTMLLAGFIYCQAQDAGEYTPPVNLTGAAREEVIAHIEKGKILYKKKCARCHGIFTKGKESIPNFSQQELKTYNIKFIQEDPENHAFTQKMTDEELTDVIYFLKFYNRPGTKPAATTPQN